MRSASPELSLSFLSSSATKFSKLESAGFANYFHKYFYCGSGAEQSEELQTFDNAGSLSHFVFWRQFFVMAYRVYCSGGNPSIKLLVINRIDQLLADFGRFLAGDQRTDVFAPIRTCHG